MVVVRSLNLASYSLWELGSPQNSKGLFPSICVKLVFIFPDTVWAAAESDLVWAAPDRLTCSGRCCSDPGTATEELDLRPTDRAPFVCNTSQETSAVVTHKSSRSGDSLCCVLHQSQIKLWLKRLKAGTHLTFYTHHQGKIHWNSFIKSNLSPFSE